MIGKGSSVYNVSIQTTFQISNKYLGNGKKRKKTYKLLNIEEKEKKAKAQVMIQL